jgi:phosphopantothenoylcysteine decarboxylase/phosphopantothenate--cysteine ligase
MAFVGLGVSGGIGAYKSVEVARLLQKRGHRVQAVMTRNARRFVGPLTFEAITREPVITTAFAPSANANIEHIALASSIDVLLVAPATANCLAKFAHGLADDFLSALYLATRAPVLVAPAMNTNMWEHPATQANVALLRQRGVHFVDPGEGYLACGWVGAGRLAEPDTIVLSVEALLSRPGRLTGRQILVSAGPTIEDIDPVRFIGNRSSGRMGIALAERAARRGADVTLVAANMRLPTPAGVRRVDVETTAELAAAVRERFEGTHVLLMAAAVADFRAARPAAGKLEREGTGSVDLPLARTEDVLAGLAPIRTSDQTLVGFAAEHGAEAIERARAKLERKGLDAIVFNDVSRADIGFDSDLNEVVIVERDAEHRVELAPKTEVADAILDRVEELRKNEVARSKQP